MTPNELSIERYKRRAAGYDESAQYTMPLRRRTIALLQLQPGQVVLDVGAGTGLSYALLRDGVGDGGPCGRVRAKSRDVRAGGRFGWTASAGATCGTFARRQRPCNCQSRPTRCCSTTPTTSCARTEALANLMRQVKPGARIAVAGIKYFPWWTGPLNIYTWLKNRPYNAKPGDLWHPWDRIETYCQSLQRWTTQFGMGYIACGVKRDC